MLDIISRKRNGMFALAIPDTIKKNGVNSNLFQENLQAAIT